MPNACSANAEGIDRAASHVPTLRFDSYCLEKQGREKQSILDAVIFLLALSASPLVQERISVAGGMLPSSRRETAECRAGNRGCGEAPRLFAEARLIRVGGIRRAFF